jgi:hypothetical protein
MQVIIEVLASNTLVKFIQLKSSCKDTKKTLHFLGLDIKTQNTKTLVNKNNTI